MSDIEKQIELEKQMTQQSIDKYRREFEKNKQQSNLANSKSGNIVISNIISRYIDVVKEYVEHYLKGNAVRSTIASSIINKLGVEVSSYIACKEIINTLNKGTAQFVYKSIGQALEDEYKMRSYKKENAYYYNSIQDDLNSRCAKAQRKKYITMNMFKKRLDFHLSKWSNTEKVQTGLILTKLFYEKTGLIEFRKVFKGKKQVIFIDPSPLLTKLIEDTNTKLEVLEPFFLPMVCEPKKWTGIFDGGYLSPYLRRNKIIKNNDREYLNRLSKFGISKVFEALNTIQETKWQINNEVLNVVKLLWEEGHAVAGLPQREDIPIQPYPFPNQDEHTILTDTEKGVVAQWKRNTYETHKQNVAARSIRILTSQIIRIADKFKDYKTIWFPYQMDFRGRMYPIPVLLHPQGSDLAKGLLRFAEGKTIDNEEAKEWFLIQGANMYGYDKASYKDRVKWTEQNSVMIINCAEKPLEHREWTEADKPLQFLAWCFEYQKFKKDKIRFKTHIPIQLDGTCNGLQHYSALLRDKVSGSAVNLVNTEIPSDIYAKVAKRLEEKLNELSQSTEPINNPMDMHLSSAFLNIGINRKLTKRPVMVLPYGGTQLSCREYIGEYLKENYSSNFLWEHFKIGNNPQDCIFKVSNWLSHYLWEAIRETLQSAIVGMDYLKAIARVKLKYSDAIEWVTPMGLLIHQAYQKNKKHEIKTELFGKILKTRIKAEGTNIDKSRQLNGICPNFIHSLDASCLMLWLLKCKEAGIKDFMSVHDCYAVNAADTAKSARLLRKAFVEIYKRPILDDFEADLAEDLPSDVELPNQPKQGDLEIEEVLKSDYFFN